MNKSHVKTAAVVLGVLAFAAVVAAQSTDPKPFLGAWKGTLSVAGRELQIGLNFSLDEAKKIQGTFDSISQGAMGIKLGSFEIKAKTIAFVIDNPNIPGAPSFKGTVDGTGKKMTGDFVQGGFAGRFAVDKQ